MQIQTLPNHNQLIFEALHENRKPFSTCGLLAQLRYQRMRKPFIVYRALENLIRLGMEHCIETLHALIVHRAHREQVADFIICRQCRKVKEIEDNPLILALHHITYHYPF